MRLSAFSGQLSASGDQLSAIGELLAAVGEQAPALTDGLAVLLLGTALLSVLARRLEAGVLLLGVQGALLAGVAGVAAVTGGDWHAWAAAGVTVVVKALAIPIVLRLAIRELRVREEARPVLSRKLLLPIAVGLVLVAYYVAEPLAPPGGFVTRNALPAAFAMLLIGLFTMLTRRKAAAQVVALVTMENGLYLAALVATRGLPLAVELGIAADILVGVVVMGAVFREISLAFDSTDTDRLRSLRG